MHELIGPLPALELIREIALRFPAVGVILVTADAGPRAVPGRHGLRRPRPDRPAAGLRRAGRPRPGRRPAWSAGVRRHLGARAVGPSLLDRRRRHRRPPSAGAKGGVGTTLTAVQLALAAHASGRSTALVDMDLQAGDIASYLDVQFRRSVADLAAITDISPRVLADAVFPHDHRPRPAARPRPRANAARRSPTAPPARSSAPCAPATRSSSSTAAPSSAAPNAAAVETGRPRPAGHHPRRGRRTGRQADGADVGPAPDPQGGGDPHRRQPRLTRHTEIQPPLIPRSPAPRSRARPSSPPTSRNCSASWTRAASTTWTTKGTVKQALWGLAGELGLVATPTERGSGAGAGPRTGGRRRGRSGRPGRGRRSGGGRRLRRTGP